MIDILVYKLNSDHVSVSVFVKYADAYCNNWKCMNFVRNLILKITLNFEYLK